MENKISARVFKTFKGIKPFFLDFLVVVFGIMLSLWFNDRRQRSEARSDEKQILLQVLEDLKADTAKLQQNIDGIDDLARNSIKLVQISRDSILANCIEVYDNTQSVITYIPFDPSRVGYFELSTQGKSGKVTDKKLLMDVMDLYENGYKRIIELTGTHREYLVNRVYGYIAQKMPYVYTVKGTIIPNDKQQAIANVVLADEFKHLLFFDIVLKQNLVQSYTDVNLKQKELIGIINKKLGEL